MEIPLISEETRFSSPEEELQYLRGKIAEKEKELNENRQEFTRDKVIKDQIKEYKMQAPDQALSKGYAMLEPQLEKRMPFRRVLKQMVEKAMANRDVQGIKILLSGRLGGADMSRKEELKRGRIPLQTFRADIDFTRYEANLPYGNIGIKVWIYKGEIFEKEQK